MSALAGRLGAWLRLVRFSHSIFALPFALSGAWLAARGVPDGRSILWILVALVCARTAAMAFNRWVDARLDAQNPRTRTREIPAGVLSRASVLTLTCVAAAAFVAAAFQLNDLCGWLALPVLGVLLGYSLAKRFTSLAHLWLGLALGLAPCAAWLAVRGGFDGQIEQPLLLSGAVVLWVAGFDLIYACQDAEFDRRSGLSSIPARFGVATALRCSSAAHVACFALLIALGVRAELHAPWWGALALSGALFLWQHRLVQPDDLSRVDLAFFTLNGWIGVLLFLGLAVDLGLWPTP